MFLCYWSWLFLRLKKCVFYRPNIIIPAKCGQTLSSRQNVDKHYHPGKMWTNIIIPAKCGQTLSSRQNVDKHYHPGKMWTNIIIPAKCGQTLSSRQNVDKHYHPGKMWTNIIIPAKCGQTLSSRQNVDKHYHAGKFMAKFKIIQKVVNQSLLFFSHDFTFKMKFQIKGRKLINRTHQILGM